MTKCTVFVRKSGVDSVVKLEVVSDSRKLLAGLVGRIAGAEFISIPEVRVLNLDLGVAKESD